MCGQGAACGNAHVYTDCFKSIWLTEAKLLKVRNFLPWPQKAQLLQQLLWANLEPLLQGQPQRWTLCISPLLSPVRAVFCPHSHTRMLPWDFILLLHIFLEVFAVQKWVKHFLGCVCRGWQNLKENVPFVLQFAFVLEPKDHMCHLGMGC